jgi:adenylylsulfate kinase
MANEKQSNQYNLSGAAINDVVSTHCGAVLWLTGLSGSGKSTVSEVLQQQLNVLGIKNYILDGDKIRTGLCSDLGFSPENRQENIRRIGEVAKLFCNAGIVTIVAFISPYQEDRDRVRGILAKGDFVEVFVDCSLEECEKRDPKGLYAKARSGEIKEFTGVSAPYEAPINPEVHLHTDNSTPEQCAKVIMDYLKQNKVIG